MGKRRLSMGIALWVLGTIFCFSAFAKVEVVVWDTTSRATKEYLSWAEKGTEVFEKENPGATLRFEYGPNSADRWILGAAAGTLPDVGYISVIFARELYDAGLLLELNHFVNQAPHMTMDKFFPITTLFNQKDGQVYGIPLQIEAHSLAYNMEHLNEAGLGDAYGGVKTWDDLVAYGRRLTQRDAENNITRSGYVGNRSLADFATYVYANGGDFYAEGGTKVAFNSERGVAALEFMSDILHKYRLTREGGAMKDIATRKASMVQLTWTPPTLVQPEDPNYAQWFGVAPFPHGPHGTGPSAVGWSNMWAIPATAKNPKLGWAYIELFMRPEYQVQEFLHYGGVHPWSPRIDFYSTKAFFECARRVRYVAALPEIYSTPKPYPFIKTTELNRTILSLLQRAMTMQISPRTALEEAERLANALLGG